MTLIIDQKEIKTMTSSSARKRWMNLIDSGLHLCLGEEKVKQVWRFLYRYNPWRWIGTLIGSMILTVSIQYPIAAQIGKKAEQEIDKVFKGDRLGGVTDFVDVIFGSGRLMIYGLGFGLIAYGLFDAINGRGSNWHIWVGIGSALLIAVAAHSVLESAVFG